MFYDRVTDFIFRSDRLKKSDFIFIPGSGYGELAVKAAELYHNGYAPKIMVSGKYSILHQRFQGAVSPKEYCNRSFETESDFLKQVLMDHGVREEDVIQEKEAAFTYENAIYIRILLEQMGYQTGTMPQRVLLVCQAFHGARAGMYFEQVFPDTEVLVCPAVTQEIDRENWYRTERGIQTVLGEMERIGTQFPDLMLGRDKAEERCRKKAKEKAATQK